MLRRGIATIAVVAAVVTAGCAADPTESSKYQALEAQLAAAQTELNDAATAAQEAADASLAELDAVRVEADRLKNQLDDVNEARRTAGAAFGQLAELVEAQVAFGLWIAPEDIEAIQQLGVDTSVADRIIEEREWGTTWEGFALTSGGFTVNHLIARLDDQELDDAWLAYFESPLGSDEEYAAYSSFLLRLHELTIERLGEADRLIAPPREDAL